MYYIKKTLKNAISLCIDKLLILLECSSMNKFNAE